MTEGEVERKLTSAFDLLVKNGELFLNLIKLIEDLTNRVEALEDKEK